MPRVRQAKAAVPTTTSSAPTAHMPLCEGDQTTTLFIQNDSRTLVVRMLMSDDGVQWKSMGLLDPINSVSMWRRTGEHWRLVSVENSSQVLAHTITKPPTTTLYLRESS